MNIFKILKLADIFTIGNLCSGMLAIFFCIGNALLAASILLLVAVFFDYLDGKVARSLKQTNDFGKELDSLADIVSFGVAPALLYYVNSSRGIFVIMALAFFVMCGILRLARYNVGRTKVFEGVPITTNGILFPVLYFVSLTIPWTLGYWSFVFIVMGLLMISSIPIKKVFA